MAKKSDLAGTHAHEAGGEMLRLRRGNWECRQSPYLEFVNNVGGGRIIFKKAIDLLQKTRKIYAFLVWKDFDGHEVKLSRSTHFELDEVEQTACKIWTNSVRRSTAAGEWFLKVGSQTALRFM